MSVEVTVDGVKIAGVTIEDTGIKLVREAVKIASERKAIEAKAESERRAIYEAAIAERPQKTPEARCLNEGGYFYKVVEMLTDEQRQTIPGLPSWFSYESWWRGLTLEQRKAISFYEFRYD